MRHIIELEMLALIVGFKIWARRCTDRNLLVYCDNKVTVDVINTGKAKNRFSQACLRELCFVSARNNSVIKVVHLESEENRNPDSLSRWHKGKIYQERFRELTRGWNTSRIKIPKEMFEFQNDW